MHNGKRQAPTYPMQVDNCLYCNIMEKIPLTVAASVVALEDVFGSSHPYQVDLFSDDKLNTIYKEQWVSIGYLPNTCSLQLGMLAEFKTE